MCKALGLDKDKCFYIYCYHARIHNNFTDPQTIYLSPEHLNSLISCNLSLSQLKLKISYGVLMLQNLAAAPGVYKGSCSVFTHMGQWVLEGHLLGGTEASMLPIELTY
jgi:hypothetical protein